MDMVSLKDALPFAAMITVEIGEVVMTTVGKAAMTNGISNLVYVVYYNTLGTLILSLYYSFHFHRNKGPPLSFTLFCKFCLLGLLGICLVQICAFTGIMYSSTTLGSALGNLIPGLTFLLAVIFRMESVDLRSKISQAKIMGTLVSMSGAFLVTFYKGPPISIRLTSSPNNISSSLLSSTKASNWVLGGLFLSIACLSAAIWNIYQAVVIRAYPEKSTVVFFSGLLGTIQCVGVSLLLERDRGAWVLHPGIEMVAILYSGIFTGVFRNLVLTWCLHKKGPVFVALFKPLGTAIAVVVAVIFLGEIPHLGSLIGAGVITIGFYIVMWGKAKESNMAAEDICSSESSAQRAPLLSDA